MTAKIITEVVIHEHPHLDEFAGLFEIKHFGTNEFDLTGAKFGTFTTGVWPEGMSYKDYPNKLFIGCAGSPFDEHGHGNIEGKSAVRLVADYLGLLKADDRSFFPLVVEVENEDRHTGGGVKNHVAMVVKAMMILQGIPTQEVYEWLEPLFISIMAFETRSWEESMVKAKANPGDDVLEAARDIFNDIKRSWLPFGLEQGRKIIAEEGDAETADTWYQKGLEAMAAKQAEFEAATAEIKAVGKGYNIETFRGPAKMVVITTENTEVGPASRKMGYHIMIKIDGNGNVVIMTDGRRDIKLHNVARILRLNEAILRRVRVNHVDLSVEGTVALVPNWHLHEGVGTQLYNGSLTATNVEPTIIVEKHGLDRLVELVIMGLKPFKPVRANRMVKVEDAVKAAPAETVASTETAGEAVFE